MTRPGPLRLYAYQRTFFDEDPSLPGRCFEQVQKAYALDDGESEVHRALAAFHLVWQDFDKAAAHLERALDLNPNDDRIVCQRGELATCLGRPGEGEQWVRHAMRLNPYYLPRYWLRLAQALYHQGHYAEALDALQREPMPVPHAQTYWRRSWPVSAEPTARARSSASSGRARRRSPSATSRGRCRTGGPRIATTWRRP